jgi:hypothetical protein
MGPLGDAVEPDPNLRGIRGCEPGFGEAFVTNALPADGRL